MKPSKTQRAAAACALWLAALVVLAALPPTEKPDQADETMWIAVGDQAFRSALERDFSLATWNDPRFGPFGAGYPVLGKLLIGASVAAHGRSSEARALVPPGTPYDWQAVRTSRPSPPLLAAGRAPMIAMGALAAVLLFALVRTLFGSRSLAGLAAGVFLLRPLVLESSRQAMLDMPALLFGMVALALAARILHGQPEGGEARLAGAGLACGLAAATKLSGALALAVVSAWWLAARRSVPGRRILLGLAILGGAAALTFVAVQPPAWHGPLSHLGTLVEHARGVSDYEVPPERRLTGFAPRVTSLLRIGLSTSDPLDAWLGWPMVGAALVLVGIVRSLRDRGGPALSAWFGLVAAATLFSMPFDWRRWYLPLEPCWAIFQAAGLLTLATAARALLRGARAGPVRA